MSNGKGILQNLLHILCNLLCGEVIVLQYLVYVIAVEELLLETKVQYLNVGITVKRAIFSPKPPSSTPSSRVMTTS